MRNEYLSQRIANFIFGQNIQCTLINALEVGLGYTAISSGIENKYSIIKKYAREISYKTNNHETIKNIDAMRKDPDSILISPKGNFLQLEIKSRSFKDFDTFIQSNFNFNEIKNVMQFHNNVRFVYVDLSKRRLASIYVGMPLTKEAQYNNWYHPETWIDGVNNRSELLAWQEEHIFTPLMIQSDKIISRLGNEIYQT
jgi:uncharacterized protein (DUF1499 family)|tara:strand:- start:294 stop:887 length:594 start_codon:yes stop_codon:yes gene_type:complete